MEIIALSGSADCGKSNTLNIAYQLLLNAGYTQVTGHFGRASTHNFIGQDFYNNDFFDVLTKEGKLIGITTGEDSEEDLEKRLAYFKSEGCIKAICACTNSDNYLAVIKKQAHYKIIDKTSQTADALKRISDGTFAREVVALIKQ
jgi:hypothetical protein